MAEMGISASSHSLALFADAGHMLSDSFALALSLFALWVGRLPASNRATFGYGRVEILAALVNGIGLLSIALWIGWEAIARLQSPPEQILSLPMLITASVGLAVNSLNAFLLHDHSHHDLNVRGAFLHMVADALSSVGVILAAIAVWQLHWDWADGAVSLAVSGFIGVGAIPLIRQSLNILLEKTPSHLDTAELQAHLENFEAVRSVEQLRVWAIALHQQALSAHLTVDCRDGDQRDRLLRQIQTSIQQEFGIQEVFLQMSGVAPACELVNLSQPPRLELIKVLNPKP